MGTFAFEKSGLAPEALDDMVDLERRRREMKARVGRVFESEIVKNKQGIFAFDFAKRFSIDGSLRSNVDPRTGAYKDFFSRKGRVSIEHGAYYFRGERYLAADDKRRDVSATAEIFREDFEDALRMLALEVDTKNESTFLEKAALLDCMKNSAISMLTAIIQEEKIGRFRLDDKEYQQSRESLVQVAQHCVHAYYGFITGENNVYEHAYKAIGNHQEGVAQASEYILKRNTAGTFNKGYFTRPELANPLVLLASAYTNVIECKEVYPEVIIGPPAGGVELAYLQQIAFSTLRSKDCDVLLLPISLHSIKKTFPEGVLQEQGVVEYIQHASALLTGKNVLLVDDNSSTGRTIQKIYDLLTEYAPPSNFSVSVAEADLIRSRIDKSSPKRTHVASDAVFSRAIQVHPVSRVLKQRLSLREAIERLRLALPETRLQREKEAKVRSVVTRAFADISTAASFNNESISVFRGTFLSNFFPCVVQYGGKTYPSVEHAYQAQKFNADIFRSVSPAIREEVFETLKGRWVQKKYKKLAEVFADTELPPGKIKVAAGILQKQGYIVPDWEKKRVAIMADLLIQKFTNPHLRSLLDATKGTYLEEGNTWGDVFWGTYNGTGKNILGRLLMTIRA